MNPYLGHEGQPSCGPEVEPWPVIVLVQVVGPDGHVGPLGHVAHLHGPPGQLEAVEVLQGLLGVFRFAISDESVALKLPTFERFNASVSKVKFQNPPILSLN